MKMLSLVTVFFVILLKSSIQNLSSSIKNTDDYSSGEGFYSYKVHLVPSFTITEKTSSHVCFDWIHYILTGERFNSHLATYIDRNKHPNNYSLIKNIEKCNSAACKIDPASTARECPLDQFNELTKLFELDDCRMLLFGGSQQQYAGIFKFERGFVYEMTYEEVSIDDYLILFRQFPQKRVNVTNLHIYIQRPCTDGSNSARDVVQHCYYKAPYDNTTEIYIFVGVAAALFIAAVLVTVLYYNSLM